MRRLLSQALRDAGFDVVGEAADGDEALALCRTLAPDAMTLDLAMPGMDGIGVLRALRTQAPLRRAIPVVVVSAFSPQHGARAIDALAEGAFDLVAKPAPGQPLSAFLQDLGEKTRAAAASGSAVRNGAATRRPLAGSRAVRGSQRLVVVACSTGGPRALAGLMPRLPDRLGSGTLIVQHMPAGFTHSLAARLDRNSPLHVREAAAGDRPSPGDAPVAPGGRPLRVAADRTLELSDEPAVGGLRPRADLTIADTARAYGKNLLLVVLTGMGRDGLEGAREVRAQGGRILVEDESTCAVYGMPRAVAEAGLADAVLPLGDLPQAIVEEAGIAA